MALIGRLALAVVAGVTWTVSELTTYAPVLGLLAAIVFFFRGGVTLP